MFVLAEFTFGQFVLTLAWILLLAIWLWLLISIFGDLFGREDLSGGMKAFWVIFIIILPLLGILIYLVTRPKPTEEEIREMERRALQASGISPAEELTTLADLHEQGKLTDAEFAAEKQRLLG